MDTWTWGPFILQKNIMFAIVAIIAGFGLLRWRLKGSPVGQVFASIILTSLLIWIVSWKLSAAIFDWETMLRDPLMLLFSNGGQKGFVLATLLSGTYIWYASHKRRLDKATYLDSLLSGIIGGYSIYLLFLSFMGEEHRMMIGLQGLLGLGIIIGWWRSNRGTEIRRSVQNLFIFVIGCALIYVLASNTWEKGSMDAGRQEGIVGLKIGQQAPDFELQLLNGQSARLSDYRGKTVLINFWATWCPPCRAEMPMLQQFYKDHEKENIVILGVNASSTEASIPAVESWIKEWGTTYPILLDAQGDVAKTYRVNAYPSTMVIDGNGIIRAKYFGSLSLEQLKEAVSKAGGR